MSAERIVLMTIHFCRRRNTPTVTSGGAADVRAAQRAPDPGDPFHVKYLTLDRHVGATRHQKVIKGCFSQRLDASRWQGYRCERHSGLTLRQWSEPSQRKREKKKVRH